MALTVEKIKRVFEYEGKKLADPNPKLQPNKVRDIYANTYPELTNAEIKVHNVEKNIQKIEFIKSVGTKG